MKILALFHITRKAFGYGTRTIVSALFLYGFRFRTNSLNIIGLEWFLRASSLSFCMVYSHFLVWGTINIITSTAVFRSLCSIELKSGRPPDGFCFFILLKGPWPSTETQLGDSGWNSGLQSTLMFWQSTPKTSVNLRHVWLLEQCSFLWAL